MHLLFTLLTKCTFLLLTGDDEGEDSEESSPSAMDYIMHFVTLFWKVVFAFIPPTGKNKITFIPVILVGDCNTI